MTDPFSVFSTAGNVLQFADLSIEIIKKTIEYSNTGGSQEHQVLQDAVQRLMATASYFHSSFTVSEEYKNLPPGPLRALCAANIECMKVSQQCFNLLDKLKLNRYGSIWRSLRLTLLTLSKKNEIGELRMRIKDARLNLVLALMVYLQHQQKNNQQELIRNHRDIMSEFAAVTKDAKTFHALLHKLTDKIDQLHVDDRSMEEHFSELRESHPYPIVNMSVRLDPFLRESNPEVVSTSEVVQSAILPMSSETQARRRIIQSLRFPKMYERQNSITRAHPGTYEWIFEHSRSMDFGDHIWSSYVDWLFNDHESRLYWIHGKPGCGKTTMIRELDERVAESCKWESDTLSKATEFQQALRKWGGDGNILTVSGYFWYAGTIEQKSLDGLLQSLTFQLLEQRPDLIDKALSASRWDNAMCSDYPMEQHWDKSEIMAILLNIVQLTADTDKILFFIDGLDEQDGPDAYRYQLLDLINNLTQHGHVKSCIASRSWNIFRDAFENCPQIQLEDYTKGDISKFVYGKLASNIRFQRQERRNPGLLKKVLHIITLRARGVFLWVMLVVRDVLKVVQDGGDADYVLKELDAIPPDLDEYFKRILQSIDPRYRTEAAVLLLSTLSNMHYPRQGIQELISGPDMRLLHLEYLNKATDPGFALDSPTPRTRSTHVEEIEYILEDLHRKLNSRSMGLLEIRRSSDEPTMFPVYKLWRMKIEFLHRTARDFLHKTSTRDILQDYLDNDFNALLFRCNLLIIDVGSASTREYSNSLHAHFSCFFSHIQDCANNSDISFDLFEKMFSLNKNGAWSHGRSRPYNTRALHTFPLLYQSLADRHETPLSLAIKLGWKAYVDRKLEYQSIVSKQGRHMLDCALRPDLFIAKAPEPWIVKLILKLGGNPNDLLLSGYRNFPLWAHFLHYAACIDNPDHDELLDIAYSLLEHGIHESPFVVDIDFLNTELDPLPPRLSTSNELPETISGRERIDSPIAFLALLKVKLPTSAMLSALTNTDMIRLTHIYNDKKVSGP